MTSILQYIEFKRIPEFAYGEYPETLLIDINNIDKSLKNQLNHMINRDTGRIFNMNNVLVFDLKDIYKSEIYLYKKGHTLFSDRNFEILVYASRSTHVNLITSDNNKIDISDFVNLVKMNYESITPYGEYASYINLFDNISKFKVEISNNLYTNYLTKIALKIKLGKKDEKYTNINGNTQI